MPDLIRAGRPPLGRSLAEALRALRPRRAIRRPAVFLLEAAAVAAAYAGASASAARGADFAEAAALLATAFLTALAPALAEGAPRALAAAWRDSARGLRTRQAFRDGTEEAADAEHLRAGDCVVVAAGETIPCDGEVLEGAATVDESALTGESAPVLREAAAPRARVVGGARVLSDRLKIRVDGAPGEGLLGRLAGRLEPSLGRMAGREAALAAAALVPAALILASGLRGAAAPDLPAALGAAAAAALILPTTLTALGGAAGSLGLRRLLRRGLLARDAAAVGAVARAQTLIVEESAAVSGRRRAVEFVAAPGIPDATLADAAQLASLIDESPEGRSIVALAESKGLRGRRLADMTAGRFVLLPPHTGVSGCDDGELIYRKGPAAAIAGAVGGYSPELASAIDRVRRTGGEAVAVAVGGRAFGVVNMREPEGRGLRDVLGRLRAAGLRAVLAVRADSAASRALAVEVGADECAVAASPAAREALVEREKAAGRRTAAAGDAASDAALLAKCDAAFARGLRATPGAEAAVLDLAEDPIQAAAAVEDARAARRARAALDAAAWLCDAAKGAAAAALLLRLLNPGAPAGLFASAPSAALALGLTAFGLAPLLALTALALAGRL